MNEPRAAPRSLLAPYLLRRDLFPAAAVASLLEFASAHEAAFRPAVVGVGAQRRHDPTARRSVAMRDLEEWRPMFEAQVLAGAPQLMAELRVSSTPAARLELELVAHGDGDFFSRHVDLGVGQAPARTRVLSGVYYFHRQPKAFSGGALRLHAIGGAERFVDIEPEHNALVVFPSWVPHEVRPVTCLSGAFADSRFAVNCWVNSEAMS